MHVELLATARKLICAQDGKLLSQTDIRRSASTAYYALFHFVSFACVSSLLGDSQKNLSRAKKQAYRSLEHRDIETACKHARNKDVGFPKEIQAFASLFISMRRTRETADYDPDESSNFQLAHVQHLIGECEVVIRDYEAADIDDRRAFAILASVKARVR